MMEGQKKLEEAWYSADHHSESARIAQEWKHTQEMEAQVFGQFTTSLQGWQVHAEEEFEFVIHDATRDEAKLKGQHEHSL